MSTPKRILVTGGTGVIGAWAVREIAEAGDEPIVLTRGVTNVGRGILGELADELEFVSVDLGNALALADVIRRVRPDVIAHLASAKPWQMDAGFVEHPDPQLGVRTIIDGTASLLEIARMFEVPRIVFASSKSAYAAFEGQHGAPTYAPVKESYPSIPVSVYGLTKLAAEHLGTYYRRHLGVDFIALRFASTYGPLKRGAGIAPAGLIAAAIDGQAVRARFRETPYYKLLDEFVYNRDIGRAIQLACQVDQTRDVVFNIGTGVGSSIRDVVSAIADVDGATSPEVEVVPDSDETAVGGHLEAGLAGVFDCRAAREQLGFEARYDLRAGIEDSLAVVRGAERVKAA